MKIQKYEIEHMNMVREISPECMVLLKYDGSFPLKKAGKIALFGSGARHTVKGGTGSGDVNVRSYVTIEQGLINAGFEITTADWLKGYDAFRDAAKEKFKADLIIKGATAPLNEVISMLDSPIPEPEYNALLTGEGDTAVYVLARNSGEGGDRKAESGDIKLTSTEIKDILAASKQYPKFLLVLNVGGIVDLSPIINQVNNILLLSQLGSSIGDAFADVLLGKTYPSGKLASTWAAWDDYCTVGEFGHPDDTRYREGVYVGYRYFDSVGKNPLFPFGYGLGYTTFSVSAGKPALNGSKLTVSASVKNTGNFCGKEVVQLYVSVPSDKLDQPYQTLAAFQKTKELAPGEETELILSFDMSDLRSFDAKTACRILEKGNYVVRLGNSSRKTMIACAVVLDERVNIEQVSHVGGSPDFIDWIPERINSKDNLTDTVTIQLSASSFKPVTQSCPQIDPGALALVKTLSDEDLAHLCTGGFNVAGSNNSISNTSTAVPGASGITTSNFTLKGVPDLVLADGPAGIRVDRQYGVDDKGVYPIMAEKAKLLLEVVPKPVAAKLMELYPDAGSKYRGGEIREQNCTAIPIGTALAQSWNTYVVHTCGKVIAEEMKIIGVHIWLAPAMNIHRNPLCGRNFEYFSEDPLISGKMAASFSISIQQYEGCGVTVKHFTCNNQEHNRLNSNSQLSERALRDIYMRGFEIAIKEGKPAAVMSSYNLLNGEHTSQREDLMETVLRKEWGHAGIVMSDWISPENTWITPETAVGADKNKHPRACASGCVAAGNDVVMPGHSGHVENMLRALNNPQAAYLLKRENLEKCAARMISIAWKLTGKTKKN